MRRTALLLVLLAGCEGTPLERSCAGARVGLCAPRELAEASNASLEPEGLVIADFSMNAHIHVEIARCADAPAPHVIDLIAIATADAGARVMTLLSLQDGMDGDATAGDGIIDVSVRNPFIVTVPPESDLVLRFTPRSTAAAGCTGTYVEIPYRTGMVRPPLDAGL